MRSMIRISLSSSYTDFASFVLEVLVAEGTNLRESIFSTWDFLHSVPKHRIWESVVTLFFFSITRWNGRQEEAHSRSCVCSVHLIFLQFLIFSCPWRNSSTSKNMFSTVGMLTISVSSYKTMQKTKNRWIDEIQSDVRPKEQLSLFHPSHLCLPFLLVGDIDASRSVSDTFLLLTILPFPVGGSVSVCFSSTLPLFLQLRGDLELQVQSSTRIFHPSESLSRQRETSPKRKFSHLHQPNEAHMNQPSQNDESGPQHTWTWSTCLNDIDLNQNDYADVDCDSDACDTTETIHLIRTCVLWDADP